MEPTAMITLLEAKLKAVLGLRDGAPLDPDVELSHYGVTSINAAKLSHALTQAFGQEVSPGVIIEHFSLAALARYLVEQRGLSAAAPGPSGPSKEELVEKILQAMQRKATPAPVAAPAPAPAPRPSARLDYSFIFFSSQRGAAAANPYGYVTTIAQYADANGFQAIWVPERHFFEFGGIFPDPAVLLAHVA